MGDRMEDPLAMVASYVLALSLSIAHLSLLLFLDKKPIQRYPQSYVTTASTVLASAFGLSLQAALAIAFTQNLWHVLRKSAQDIDTIEHLFSMRNNPLLALRWAILRNAPFLVLFVILQWSLQVATTFPPGALTVASVQYSIPLTVQATTLNTSFVGEGDVLTIMTTAIAMVESYLGYSDGIISVSFGRSKVRSYENVLLCFDQFHTMISRSTTISTSPCGLNCTYQLQFAGPYLKCEMGVQNLTIDLNSDASFTLYSGVWSNPLDSPAVEEWSPDSVTSAIFNVSTYTPLGLGRGIVAETRNLKCKPYQAQYGVTVTFLDGIESFTVQANPIRPLSDLENKILVGYKLPDCDCSLYPGCPCGPKTKWTNTMLEFVSDLNNLAIIESMALALEGSYIAYVSPQSNTTIDVNGNAYYKVVIDDGNGWDSTAGPQNGTIIAMTGVNANIDQYNNTYDKTFENLVNLVLTQDILNEMLQNITLSLMNEIGIWSTTVNATQSAFTNVYSFSNRLNLLLPYYLSLAISLPLLILGGYSLYQNGVSAMNGGFLQILTTTSTSKALNEVASMGALGGAENVSRQLKELKIRFGEIVGSEEEGKRTRRVGFGVEDEVIPLRKGTELELLRAQRVIPAKLTMRIEESDL